MVEVTVTAALKVAGGPTLPLSSTLDPHRNERSRGDDLGASATQPSTPSARSTRTARRPRRPRPQAQHHLIVEGADKRAILADRGALQPFVGTPGGGVHAGKPVSKLRYSASVAESNATQIREPRTTRWPVNLRAPIGDLVAEPNAAQPYWRRSAVARTRQELGEAVVAAGRHDGSEPAGTVRKLLGLDDYDENDYG